MEIYLFTWGLKLCLRSRICIRSLFQNASNAFVQSKALVLLRILLAFNSSLRMTCNWTRGCKDDSKQTSIKCARLDNVVSFSMSSLSFLGSLEMDCRNCFQDVMVNVIIGHIGEMIRQRIPPKKFFKHDGILDKHELSFILKLDGASLSSLKNTAFNASTKSINAVKIIGARVDQK